MGTETDGSWALKLIVDWIHDLRLPQQTIARVYVHRTTGRDQSDGNLDRLVIAGNQFCS